MYRTLLAVTALFVISTPTFAQETAAIFAPVADADESLRYWARAEYLLWWIRGEHASVPLATTGPIGVSRSGALGEPNTGVLIGPDLNYRPNSGGKLFLGGWIDAAQTIGVEATGFCLETHTIHEKVYSNRTNGTPVITRPFFNTLTGQQDAEIITGPADALGGRYLGGIGLFSDSRTWGGEMNLLLHLGETRVVRWDLVGGIRYLGQKDEFRFDDSSTVLRPGTVGFAGRPAPGPDIVSLRDYLESASAFYGAQIGLQGHADFGPLTCDSGIRVGLGTNQEHLETLGRTLLTNSAGTTLYQPGGLFVPANASIFARGQLGSIAEFNLRVGYRVTERWLASVGYTILYWGDIIRPAGQINPIVDPRTVPSSLAYNPAVTGAPLQLHSTDYWAQGLTFGLEYRY
jgi:hypothetical protein